MHIIQRLGTMCSVLVLATIGTPFIGAPAAAQTAQETDASEIVVTAQRRSERLQDVPVSVTALSGAALARQRLDRVDDLVSKVANLQFSGTVGDSTPIFSLRGVSMSDFSLNQAGPVATYYDEVYKGNFALLGIALYDLERVEVLRGPQGTLYGRNTTGGAVNIISKRPSFKTEGNIGASVGNFDRRDINGAVNVPLSSELAIRVAGTLSRADGWYKNLLPGQPDLQAVREYGLRGSLLWQPADGASFLLRASTSHQNPYNYGGYSAPGPDGVGAGVYEAFGQGSSYFRTGLKRRQIESNFVDRRRGRTYALSLTSEIELQEGLDLTSVSSWDKGRLSFDEDSDGSPVRTLEISYAGKARQLAQDLRLTSSWSGPFNFILGGYYNREKVYNSSNLGVYRDLDVDGDGLITGLDCAAALPLACNVTNSFGQVKHSYAVYTDLRYNIGETLTVRGGLRYTRDDGRQSDFRSDAFGVDGQFIATLIPLTNLAFKDDNLSGKIGIDYKPSRDLLLYASYSRGYRGRSFNAQAFFDPSETSVAKPETIDAFEMGAKSQLFDRRVTLNLSGFYYRYQNQQFVNIDPNTTAQTLINVERSRIYGGELEMSARASDRLDLRLGLGLLNARVQRGTLNGLNLQGKKLLNAPSLSVNGGVDFTAYDDNINRISLHPEISYVSSQYFEVLNIPRLQQKGYALLGGRIDFDRGPLTLSIWGKNLTDKIYYTARIDAQAGFGFDYNHIGTPRTYGISLRYKF